MGARRNLNLEGIQKYGPQPEEAGISFEREGAETCSNWGAGNVKLNTRSLT
jgi:hypothetical protein